MFDSNFYLKILGSTKSYHGNGGREIPTRRHFLPETGDHHQDLGREHDVDHSEQFFIAKRLILAAQAFRVQLGGEEFRRQKRRDKFLQSHIGLVRLHQVVQNQLEIATGIVRAGHQALREEIGQYLKAKKKRENLQKSRTREAEEEKKKKRIEKSLQEKEGKKKRRRKSLPEKQRKKKRRKE